MHNRKKVLAIPLFPEFIDPIMNHVVASLKISNLSERS